MSRINENPVKIILNQLIYILFFPIAIGMYVIKGLIEGLLEYFEIFRDNASL